LLDLGDYGLDLPAASHGLFASHGGQFRKSLAGAEEWLVAAAGRA
jgi:hypothetical protein